MFEWHWIADPCARLDVTFVLGHALYMKTIDGGKVKNDRSDSEKVTHLPAGYLRFKETSSGGGRRVAGRRGLS